MFERFTDDARQVVVDAQAQARGLRADRIEPVHLLLAIGTRAGRGADALAAAGIEPTGLHAAISAAGDPLDPAALAALGVDLDRVRATVEATFGPGALELSRSESGAHLPFAGGSKRALEQALRHAVGRRRRRRGRGIDSADVLFGVLDVGDPVVTAVLRQLGTTAAAVQDRVDATEAA
ncbi:Clp protease N-terminal domain-containing protein [Modestobacter roseus]|uniref:ClpA/ClpB-like protein n=1 Tax=Modestobacter roseus TaxID=1181884 RepID=A0A562IM68_9ACTN|nr:Clp protease N-terminal domain-containing protein [Modestobacter roseus]TWH72101.1 ClpA/ClpB-like protein [Modestobacter roseus]